MVNNKIGIFCHSQHGDIGLCTAVLKYKNVLWPGKEIVWFGSTDAKSTLMDMLKFNDAISEIRGWPAEDFRTLKDKNGQLILGKRSQHDCLKDLDNGYFPAPWAMLPHPSLEGVNYGEIPRRVCGADPSWEWHPYLGFSNEEREMAKDFCGSLPHAKTVMLETAILSAGGHFSDEFVRKIMQQCRDKWGKCNFIFASKITQQTKVGDYSALIDDKGVVSASQFTVRQMGLVYDYCDLFLGISSGITVAVSRWGGKPVPKVVETNDITDYSFMANGVSNAVICNDLRQQAKEEKFMPILMHTLSQI